MRWLDPLGSPERIGRDLINLEKKFVLSLVVALAPGCLLYSVLERSAEQATVANLSPREAGLVHHLLAENVVGAVLLACTVAVLAAVVAHFLFLSPLRRLVATARAVGDGDFVPRLRLERDDDIGRLADELDATCDKLLAARVAAEAHVAALEQLRHSDRISTLGRLASSVAHELGTPLNVVQLRAQLIASSTTATLEDARRNATIIVEQSQRMTRIIADVLSFARRTPRKKKNVNMVDVVRSAIALCTQTTKKRNVVVRLDVPAAGVDVQGDPDQLLQIVLNLVINGAQAMNGGELTVGVHDERRTANGDPHGDEAPYACVDVIDRGSGIQQELLPKIFDPFFSTKSAEEGTGLGLSIAQGIAREHDGWISVASEPGRGSSFSVHLPRSKTNGMTHGK